MIKSKISHIVNLALEYFKARGAKQATAKATTNTAPNLTRALARSAGHFNHK